MTFIFVGFLFISFLVVVLMLRPKKAEKAMEKRLLVITAPLKEGEEEAEILAPTVKQTGALSTKLGSYLERFDFSEDLQILILHAGSRATVGSVVFGSLMAAIAAGLMVHAIVGLYPADLAAVVVGGAGRWLLLNFQKKRRLNKFGEALPDAIELMCRALRAGHSMSSAIEVVAEQSVEPLGSEFAVVFHQQKFGIPFETRFCSWVTAFHRRTCTSLLLRFWCRRKPAAISLKFLTARLASFATVSASKAKSAPIQRRAGSRDGFLAACLWHCWLF